MTNIKDSTTFEKFFTLDFDIVKSEEKGKEGIWGIKGFASTDKVDQDDEKILQEGLDFSYFLNKGWFNWDHNRSNIVGIPTKAELITLPADPNRKGLYVEGELLKDVPQARDIWTLANALHKSDSRKLGMSIEGRRENVEGSTVKKAVVYNVAITPHPINPEAQLDVLIKSFKEVETDTIDNEIITRLDNIEKAMAEVGYKVKSIDQTSAGATRKESINKKLKKQDIPEAEEEDEEEEEEKEEENEEEENGKKKDKKRKKEQVSFKKGYCGVHHILIPEGAYRELSDIKARMWDALDAHSLTQLKESELYEILVFFFDIPKADKLIERIQELKKDL
ncbi:MAG: HK97 family phage prohead protease [Sulfurimonas sp.]